MRYFPRLIVNILVIVSGIMVTGSCRNKDVVPLIKEVIDGEIKYIQIQIFLRGIGEVYMDIVDKTDGKLYEVHMTERGGTALFNAYAYIDNTDLILPETKEVPFGENHLTTAFAINPVQSLNNRVHVNYAEEKVDSRFSTKSITGEITPNTILVINSEEEEAIAVLRTREGIQRYLKSILRDGLDNNFSKDINDAQEGNQINRFLVYKLHVDSGRVF